MIVKKFYDVKLISKLILKFIFLGAFFYGSAFASHDLGLQSGLGKSSGNPDAPLEIFADETEWDRENNRVIARGNAILKKNSDQITASEVVGYFEEKDGKRHLAKVDAFQNVVITTPTGEIKGGDKGTYFTDTQYMIIEGPQIVLTSSKNESLTTEKKLEYWELEKKAFAENPVTILREKDIIKGNQLTAFFAEDAETKQTKLSKADLVGNVEIVTPTQTANGDKSVYKPMENVAILEGNVTLTQEGNVLKGEWCRANLLTGHNMLRNAAPDGPVSTKPVYALLIPKSKAFQKTTEQKKTDQKKDIATKPIISKTGFSQ